MELELVSIFTLEAGDGIVSATSDGIVLNKIPALIRTTMKKAATSTTSAAAFGTTPLKNPKYVIQAGSAAAGISPWHSVTAIKRESLGIAISSLPPNTIIKRATPAPKSSKSTLSSLLGSQPTPVAAVAPATRVSSAVHQAVFIKRELPQQRSMRAVTLGLMENATMLHLGLASEHLSILKRHICRSAAVTHLDCCIALRKLRQNESFALLAECFELSESDAEETFKRTIIKLARCLRPLICWPDANHFLNRLKHTPLDYRSDLMHLRSMIECVETDVSEALDFSCPSYKFILCINTNGIISYISSAYPGQCDDLQLFEASNFKNIVPDYLTLCADPGKAVPRSRQPVSDSIYEADEDDDSASLDEQRQPVSKYDAQRLSGQLASQESLSVVDGALVSKRAPSVQLPTMRLQEPACRAQMRATIDTLREYKMLHHSSIHQKSMLGYLNEMLIVAAALCNLKRKELSS
ncbi:uncharacterized protein Camp isoform X2 [Drosophila pseudoobscura]|uniref:Uncharacterized protein Camp isoform X2 n=1 Tax=Drosophila pseudoobscura pseudoobscura TaxID=46245 RepID=A0A6I8VVF0_DROPS|nr:uncharacterized protein LOC4805399 isoform X2 [Drosophila pseudoobscura]